MASRSRSRSFRLIDEDIESAEVVRYEGDEQEVNGLCVGKASLEENQLFNRWFQQNLRLSLEDLIRCQQEDGFVNPLPWEDLEFEDFLVAVRSPTDLKAIGEKLEQGGYEDMYGFIDPIRFWCDVRNLWAKCARHFEDDLTIVTMAENMSIRSAIAEDILYSELQIFEELVAQYSCTAGSLLLAVDSIADYVYARMA